MIAPAHPSTPVYPTQVSGHHQLTTTFTLVGHADMMMFMRLLRAAAQKHGLCILVCVPFTSLRRCQARPISTDEEVCTPSLTTGAKRRDSGGSSGTRCILYVHD